MTPRHVLITGANRGIGLALTRAYLEAGGWAVYACCRDPGHAGELSALCGKYGEERVEILALDVTEAQSVAALGKSLAGRPLDVLVNNAGIYGDDRQSAFDMDYEAWRETLEINTLAPLRVAGALIASLRLSDNPKIITVSSQMGSLARKGVRGVYAYRSSKAAVNMVMKLLAADLAQEGVIVCPVHPGWVRTDMGGEDADISPEESAAGLLRVISGLRKEHSGRFWQWDGEEHPW